MSKLTEKDYTGEIISPEEMLARWQKTERDIAEVGQSYDAGGGVVFTFADLDKVRAAVRYWHKRVLARKGAIGRNIADISPHNENDAETLT